MRHFRLKPPLAPKLSENDVERTCLDLLAYRGWYVVRLQSGLFKTVDGRFVRVGAPGLPDYVCLHAERPAFFLETKRQKGALSLVQEQKQFEINVCFKIPTITIDKVEDLIDYLDKRDEAGK
jgi:hypothetical protein